MIIFLYGPDTFRSRQKLNEIIERYKKIHKSGLNLKFFEGEELKFEDLKDEFQQSSMFKEKKLVVLTNFFSNLVFKERFLKEGKNFVNSVDIILFYEKNPIPEKDSLFHFLIKNAKSQEFKLLAGQKLKNWVKKEFLNYGIEINQEALEKLISFVGNDLWQMENEIKKLAAYKTGHNQVTTLTKVCPEIKKEDVELLVKPKIETDIFKTIDAIASKNKKEALKLLRAHLEKGDSPLYLFSMINFQFRNVLIVKDLIERNLSPHDSNYLRPYLVKKIIPFLEKFSLSKLKKIYQKLFQLDLAIKTGKISPEVAIDLLITEI
jgi:DNA polymerase-3 subunit delta